MFYMTYYDLLTSTRFSYQTDTEMKGLHEYYRDMTFEIVHNNCSNE